MTAETVHGIDTEPLAQVVPDLLCEYLRAKLKHGENTLDGANATDALRLAALVEEVGEVAQELTYDHQDADQQARLRKELVQVANVALTWASILPAPVVP